MNPPCKRCHGLLVYCHDDEVHQWACLNCGARLLDRFIPTPVKLEGRVPIAGLCARCGIEDVMKGRTLGRKCHGRAISPAMHQKK